MVTATAWLIYGIKIPTPDTQYIDDLMDDVLRPLNEAGPKVSYLQAGASDPKNTYLTVFEYQCSADKGPEPLHMDTLWVSGSYDSALYGAAMALGVRDLPESPEWMLVCDLTY